MAMRKSETTVHSLGLFMDRPIFLKRRKTDTWSNSEVSKTSIMSARTLRTYRYATCVPSSVGYAVAPPLTWVFRWNTANDI